MKKVVTIILMIILIPMVYYLIVGINNFNTVEELYNIINIDEYRDRQMVNIRYIYLLLIILFLDLNIIAYLIGVIIGIFNLLIIRKEIAILIVNII